MSLKTGISLETSSLSEVRILFPPEQAFLRAVGIRCRAGEGGLYPG